MKKITAFFLSLILLITTASVAYAEEGNFGGGGGGMGGGTGTYYWNVGYDGVRISVVNVSTNAIEKIADFSSKSISSKINHFGKICKLTYRKGKSLISSKDNYSYIILQGMPPIVLSNGSNIVAIKKYFTAKENLKVIAAAMGIDYNRIKTGQVKLVVEPMAYFCYDGGYYAMTATEAALFDKSVSGKLKYNMRPFSHNNLPLALFLESSDLGIPAYTGSTTLLCSASDSYTAVDDLIVSQLGVGIVYGVGGVVTPAGDVTVSDYEFRADTDVIIPVSFKNNGGDIVPSSNAYITYTCSLGTTYNVQLVCPSGENQLVWLKWHTPKASQTVKFVSRN